MPRCGPRPVSCGHQELWSWWWCGLVRIVPKTAQPIAPQCTMAMPAGNTREHDAASATGAPLSRPVRRAGARAGTPAASAPGWPHDAEMSLPGERPSRGSVARQGVASLRAGHQHQRVEGNMSTPERPTEHLLADLRDGDFDARWRAARALGERREGRALDPLVAALRDPERYVRVAAAVSLGRLGDARAIPPPARGPLRRRPRPAGSGRLRAGQARRTRDRGAGPGAAARPRRRSLLGRRRAALEQWHRGGRRAGRCAGRPRHQGATLGGVGARGATQPVPDDRATPRGAPRPRRRDTPPGRREPRPRPRSRRDRGPPRRAPARDGGGPPGARPGARGAAQHARRRAAARPARARG